jgi:hypothetical protein
MFIPIWVLHVVVTIIFLIVLYIWAFESDGNFDFMPIFKVPVTCLGYAIYWIIFLAISLGLKSCEK